MVVWICLTEKFRSALVQHKTEREGELDNSHSLTHSLTLSLSLSLSLCLSVSVIFLSFGKSYGPRKVDCWKSSMCGSTVQRFKVVHEPVISSTTKLIQALLISLPSSVISATQLRLSFHDFTIIRLVCTCRIFSTESSRAASQCPEGQLVGAASVPIQRPKGGRWRRSGRLVVRVVGTQFRGQEN